MATVLITGGTGLIGSALSTLLVSNGYNVIILSRNPRKTAREHDFVNVPGAFRSSGNLFYARWDINKGYIDPTAIESADHIIHLAGAGVAEKRWTAKRKQEILQSRTRGSQLLVKALEEHQHKVKTIISASAIGWYGPDKGGQPFVESDPAANDFLGQTCLQWENSIQPVTEKGIRLVILRSGIVLTNAGGALYAFRKPLRMGIAPILGSGNQMISWIHIADLCKLMLFAIEEQQLTGVFNAVTSHPVTNRELMHTLARHLAPGRHLSFPVPAFLLRLVLGEMSVEVLKSATVSSDKIKDAGFEWQFPTIEQAIRDLY